MIGNTQLGGLNHGLRRFAYLGRRVKNTRIGLAGGSCGGGGERRT